MEKKKYIKPDTIEITSATESLMITASPGIGGEYDPDQPIDAKPGFFEDEDDDEDDEMWGRSAKLRKKLWGE